MLSLSCISQTYMWYNPPPYWVLFWRLPLLLSQGNWVFNTGVTYKYVPITLYSKMVYQLLGSAHYTGQDLTLIKFLKGVIIRKMYYGASAVVWASGSIKLSSGIRQPWKACHVSLTFFPSSAFCGGILFFKGCVWTIDTLPWGSREFLKYN